MSIKGNKFKDGSHSSGLPQEEFWGTFAHLQSDAHFTLHGTLSTKGPEHTILASLPNPSHLERSRAMHVFPNGIRGRAKTLQRQEVDVQGSDYLKNSWRVRHYGNHSKELTRQEIERFVSKYRRESVSTRVG